jgi:predicted DNA-binding transcriptional regulator
MFVYNYRQQMTTLKTPQSIHVLLHRIGLNDRECDVYLALLPMKIARASAVARAAKQSRSHTYLILRSLEEKGLVAEVERGNVLHFVAEPPDRLLGYVKDREQELREIAPIVAGVLPFLASLTKPLPGEPRVTVLRGTEGIKRVYRDVLLLPFHSFFNPQTDYDHFGGNIVHMLLGKNVKLRGKELLVNNAGARRYIREVPPHEEYEIRLLPKDLAFDADVLVFGDEIAMFTFSDQPVTIRIENTFMADAFRAWHKGLWEISTTESSRETV